MMEAYVNEFRIGGRNPGAMGGNNNLLLKGSLDDSWEGITELCDLSAQPPQQSFMEEDGESTLTFPTFNEEEVMQYMEIQSGDDIMGGNYHCKLELEEELQLLLKPTYAGFDEPLEKLGCIENEVIFKDDIVTPQDSPKYPNPTLDVIGGSKALLVSPPDVVVPVLSTPKKKAASKRSKSISIEKAVVEKEPSDGTRRCVVCLRRTNFIENAFNHAGEHLYDYLKNLMSQLSLPPQGNPKEDGVCLSCLNELQQWHIFNSAISERHRDLERTSSEFSSEPVQLETFEKKLFKNYKKINELKEVYLCGTHTFYARRHLTNKDWDFICNILSGLNSLKSEKVSELVRFVMCTEKLSRLYCIKCQRLVDGGKLGLEQHWKSVHQEGSVVFPCDICGNHVPDSDHMSPTGSYNLHWISHFCLHPCGECEKSFPSVKSLGRHRTTHRKRSDKSTVSKPKQPEWKCVTCKEVYYNEELFGRHKCTNHSIGSETVINGETSEVTSYDCPVSNCDEKFFSKYTLSKHMDCHSEYVCRDCGKEFRHKKALMEHHTLHTGEKPYRCPCGRDFRVSSNLYKHMKIHKKKGEYAGVEVSHLLPKNNDPRKVPNERFNGSSSNDSFLQQSPAGNVKKNKTKKPKNKKSLAQHLPNNSHELNFINDKITKMSKKKKDVYKSQITDFSNITSAIPILSAEEYSQDRMETQDFLTESELTNAAESKLLSSNQGSITVMLTPQSESKFYNPLAPRSDIKQHLIPLKLTSSELQAQYTATGNEEVLSL